MSIKLTISEEAIPLVKAGVNIEKDFLKANLDYYSNQVDNFEKKYKMNAEIFLNKFNKGLLGDKPLWFDWLFAIKASKHLKSQLKTIESVSL